MRPWSRISVAKCQMLVTSFFVLMLGLSVATTVALTCFGAHFAVVGHAALEGSAYEALHLWAFYAGVSLAGLLTLGAVLSAAATVREAGGLMALGFLCFALVFCILVQVAFWRFQNPTQVEDAMLDTYDLVYDQAMRCPSSSGRQRLLSIQDTFLCCGKNDPSGFLGSLEADLCPREETGRQDCLQGIRSFLGTHERVVSILTSVGLASMVYAMLLSSFLWFSIRSLDRKGTYTLSPRARGCRPQEPSLFRRSPGGLTLEHLHEADPLEDPRSPGGRSGGPRLLLDH